jgi:predicted permease
MTVAFLRLLGFTLLGYLLFLPAFMREKPLRALTALVVNLMFPLYSITRYGMSWEGALAAGGSWLIWFFYHRDRDPADPVHPGPPGDPPSPIFPGNPG